MTEARPETYGAVADGRSDDTASLQAAVDVVHAAGGGTVRLTGRYRCGSVRLRSRVELHLEPSSRLVAADRIEDFTRRIVVGALANGISTTSREAAAAMIWADGAEDIAITGRGVIDGSAAAYVEQRGSYIHRMARARPFPVFLVGCTRVDLRDVRFLDAALWTLRLSGCTDVTVTGVRIDNDLRVPNSDGIDVDHCSRVRIVGCDISCPDDAIALKTTDEFTGYGACEDVLITGCTLTSRSTAVTMGVDAEQPIRRVVVTGCVVRDSHRGVSVSVGTGAGGSVEDVLFGDLVIETRHDHDDWWGGGEPIVVRSAPWHEQAGPVRRIRFRNILARSENGVLVYAGGGGSVEDVQISDLRLELRRWTDWPGRRLDLRPYDRAPAEGRIRTGLLACHPSAVRVVGAVGVSLRDVDVHVAGQEFGPVLAVDASRDVGWRGLRTHGYGVDRMAVDGVAQELPVDGRIGPSR